MSLSRVGSSLLSLSLALTLAGAIGCTQELKLIGEECKTSADCNSDYCGAKGVCTRTCNSQGECPVGFDCTLASAEATERICNKVAYPLIEAKKGGFDTGCTAELCTPDQVTTSACATDQGFYCYAIDGEACSAAAACTRDCSTDADCPWNYFCGENTLPDEDGKPKTTKACFKRERCAECRFDDECPSGYRCSEDAAGGHFCGKTCNTIDDCLKPGKGSSSYGDFETCENNVCTPTSGACHGKSSLEAVTEENALCSPCRIGMPGDCQEGYHCVQSYAGERYCSPACKAELTKGAQGWQQSGRGDCSNGLLCIVTQLTAACNKAGATTCDGVGSCTTDNDGAGFTCFGN